MDDDGRDLLIAVRSLAEENQPANEAVLEVVEITSLARQLRAEVASREQLEVLADRQSSRTDRASAVLRELQAANDVLAIETGRLRSANEELLIANEEAQASAEEVETLNEELQATNEELETLNEELQATVEELTTTNDEPRHARSSRRIWPRRGRPTGGAWRAFCKPRPSACRS